MCPMLSLLHRSSSVQPPGSIIICHSHCLFNTTNYHSALAFCTVLLAFSMVQLSHQGASITPALQTMAQSMNPTKWPSELSANSFDTGPFSASSTRIPLRNVSTSATLAKAALTSHRTVPASLTNNEVGKQANLPFRVMSSVSPQNKARRLTLNRRALATRARATSGMVPGLPNLTALFVGTSALACCYDRIVADSSGFFKGRGRHISQ